MARSARKDQLKKDELFTNLSRFKITYQLPHIYYWEAVMWMRAEGDFMAKFAGKERLHILPFHLRNEAVLVLHREVMLPCTISRSCTEDAVAEVALLLKPMVCMAGQTLIEQEQVSQNLYFLYHGSLKVQSTSKEQRMQTKKKAFCNRTDTGIPVPQPQGGKTKFLLPSFFKKDEPDDLGPGLLAGGQLLGAGMTQVGRRQHGGKMSAADIRNLPGMNQRNRDYTSGMKAMARMRVIEKVRTRNSHEWACILSSSPTP